MNPTSVSAVNMEALLRQAREASFQTATLDEAAKNNALEQFARLIEENTESLLSANQKDLAAAEANEISATMFQRFKARCGQAPAAGLRHSGCGPADRSGGGDCVPGSAG